MAAKLIFKSVARVNPTSGEIENLEVLFFSQLLGKGYLELPIAADFHWSVNAS